MSHRAPEKYAHLSRPDAVMVADRYGAGTHRIARGGSLANSTITLIEIKVCSDTDPARQDQHATEQHQQMKGLIESHTKCGNVRLRTLLVGTSGTIYKKTVQQLQELGVPHLAASKALAKAHRLVCHQLHSIVQTRRRLERPTAGPSGGRGARTHARRVG